MTTGGSDKRSVSATHRPIMTLNVPMEHSEEREPSEYTMQAPRRSSYGHGMPQERLDAIARVVSETSVQQGQRPETRFDEE